MDTQNPAIFSSISPQAFNARLGRADMPLVLDVRRQARFGESPRLLVGAQRCAPEDVAAGWSAHRVAGGFEGGQDGVDDAQTIAQLRAQPPLTFAKRPDWGVTGEQPSRWITRERPKIDRIACPWLIHRFIDARAQFFYVPTDQVLERAKDLNAVAYELPGAPVSHVGDLCSFDALLQGFDLHDAALDLAPQSPGLLAFSPGLSRIHATND